MCSDRPRTCVIAASAGDVDGRGGDVLCRLGCSKMTLIPQVAPSCRSPRAAFVALRNATSGARPQHRVIVPVLGAEPPGGQHPAPVVDGFQGHRPLVGIDPTITRPTLLASPRLERPTYRRGRAEHFEPRQSPLEPGPHHGTRWERSPEKSHSHNDWAAVNRERPVDHLDTSLARPEPYEKSISSPRCPCL